MIKKLLNLFKPAKPTCNGHFTFKAANGRTYSIDFDSVCNVDISTFYNIEPVFYSCTCSDIKKCSQFQKARNRIDAAKKQCDEADKK